VDLKILRGKWLNNVCLWVTSVKSFREFNYNVIYSRILWITMMTDDDFTPITFFFIDKVKLNWNIIK
jgi:hypothetical protein